MSTKDNSLNFLIGKIWSFNMKLCSNIVFVYTLSVWQEGGGGHGRPYFNVISFSAIILVENGISSNFLVTLSSTSHTSIIQQKRFTNETV